MLRALRERYKIIFKPDLTLQKGVLEGSLEGEKINLEIINAIQKGTPYLISRFGSEEIKWYLHFHLLSKNILTRAFNFVTCKLPSWKKEDRIIDNLTFRPKSYKTTLFFIEKMNEAIPEIDILGSWLRLESSNLLKLKKEIKSTFLLNLEPYYHQTPWSKALKGKKVLIIHPMTESIKYQFLHNREKLFRNEEVLPEFRLITLKAKYFDDPVYDTWDKIYSYYTENIKRIDFDIAIIGCGPWGMPLAAEIKKMGKIAIHLGGATQLLFGITGNRWDKFYPEFTKEYVNEFWIRPSQEEKPSWAKNYDHNAYWNTNNT